MEPLVDLAELCFESYFPPTGLLLGHTCKGNEAREAIGVQSTTPQEENLDFLSSLCSFISHARCSRGSQLNERVGVRGPIHISC